MTTAWQNATNGGVGSFRGVQFFVSSLGIQGGRRNATFEFHAKERGRSDDFGRKQRKFNVSAVVVGDTHHLARNALVTALETKGAGEFIYPLIGRVSCILDGFYRITESTQQANASQIEFTLTESGEELSPAVSAITSDAVVAAAENTKTAIAAALAQGLVVARKTARVLNRAVQSANQAASCVRRINQRIQAAFSVITEAGEAITNLGTAVATLVATPASLYSELNNAITNAIRAIDEIDTAAQSSVAALTGSGPATIGRTVSRFKRKALSEAAYGALLLGDSTRKDEHKAFFGEFPLEFSGSGASALQSIANNSAITRTTRSLLACELARASLLVSFDTTQDAIEYRDDIVALMDSAQSDADDDLYLNLATLKTSFVAYFGEQIRALPSSEVFTTQSVMSSLAVAYELDGQITYEADLSLGNSLPNPAAIPAYTELKIVRRPQ